MTFHGWIRLVVFAAMVLVLPNAQAASAETPTTVAGAVIVTAEDAKRLADNGALMVDTRVGNEYAESHIRGAVNIPYKEVSRKAADFDPRVDRFDLTQLPRDKSKPVVFYCNSGDCWKSYKATTVSVSAGYSQVYWLRGGIPEWKKKGLPIE